MDREKQEKQILNKFKELKLLKGSMSLKEFRKADHKIINELKKFYEENGYPKSKEVYF